MLLRRLAASCIWAAAAIALLSSAGMAQSVYDSGGTGASGRFLASARRAAHHGRYTEAIAHVNQALAVAPNFGDAIETRSDYEEEIGLYDEAAADLKRLAAMRPNDMAVGLSQTELTLREGDGVATLAMIKKTLAMPLRSYQHAPYEAGTYEAGSGSQFSVTGHMESYVDEYGSIAEQLLHHDDASLADMQAMMKLETQHPEYILANYCYLAGIVGLLESAEIACEQSIVENPHDIGQYDTLGYVHLRMKQWAKAIADYDKALDSRSDLTSSLYGRGIAKRAKGDLAGGDADIAAAKRDEPDIANIMRRLGVPPS